MNDPFGEPLAEDLQRRLDTVAAGLPETGPARDPYLGAWLSTAPPAGQMETGTVVDAVAATHEYRVFLGPGSYLWCTPASDAGFRSFGARPAATVGLLSDVLVVRHPQNKDLGYIIGVLPDVSFHRAYQPAESSWPFLRSGHAADEAHRLPLTVSSADAARTDKRPPSVEGRDVSGGRPLDSTTAGEAGYFGELGTAVFLDGFQAALRADETTGVFVFYGNRTLRLAGQRLQEWDPTRESERGDDEGELYHEEVRTVYPWETVGLFHPYQLTPSWLDGESGQGSRAVEDADVQAGLGDAVLEPDWHYQVPAGRVYAWAGYLGQAGRELVVLPRQTESQEERDLLDGGLVDDGTGTAQPAAVSPGSVTAGVLVEPAHRGDGYVQPGVLEEQRTLPGRWTVRTAKGVMLVKRAVIPHPRRTHHQADPNGDVPFASPPTPGGNYDPSGKAPAPGGGRHFVTDDPAWQFDGPLRLAALPDLLAYYFNWEGLLPFYYHAKDFATPEEGDPKGGLTKNQVTPRYCTLALQQYLADPTPVLLEVDHRYGHAAYYENESGFALHEDGTVQVWDGWGGTVEMGSHGIRISTAGDVDVRAGRNINLWAGHDLVCKARDSIDLTASKHDIRLAAWRNLMGVAGTGGCGGIALESQAAKASYDLSLPGEEAVISGINLIAPHSAVYMVTPDLVAESPEPDGRLVFDMGPLGLVRVYSKLHEAIVEDGGARYDLFLLGASCDTANEFRRTLTLLGTPVYVKGDVTATGNIVAGGSLGSGAGTTSVTDRLNAVVQTFCPSVLTARIGPPHSDEVEVTLRTDQNYRTQNGYTLDEQRWQTFARLDGQTALPVWTEPPVAGRLSGVEQYPFPGGAWIDPAAYRLYVPTLVEPAAGWTAVERTEANYGDPTPADPDYTTPDGVYRVVANHAP